MRLTFICVYHSRLDLRTSNVVYSIHMERERGGGRERAWVREGGSEGGLVGEIEGWRMTLYTDTNTLHIHCTLYMYKQCIINRRECTREVEGQCIHSIHEVHVQYISEQGDVHVHAMWLLVISLSFINFFHFHHYSLSKIFPLSIPYLMKYVRRYSSLQTKVYDCPVTIVRVTISGWVTAPNRSLQQYMTYTHNIYMYMYYMYMYSLYTVHCTYPSCHRLYMYSHTLMYMYN